MQPTPSDQVEGAVYIAKKHKRDLQDLAAWLGLFAIIGGFGWLVGHGLDALPHSHPIPACQSVAACQRDILAHPIHVKPMPGFPQFHGPTFNTGGTP